MWLNTQGTPCPNDECRANFEPLTSCKSDCRDGKAYIRLPRDGGMRGARVREKEMKEKSGIRRDLSWFEEFTLKLDGSVYESHQVLKCRSLKVLRVLFRNGASLVFLKQRPLRRNKYILHSIVQKTVYSTYKQYCMHLYKLFKGAFWQQMHKLT